MAQTVNLEREISQVQESCGSELLNLVVTKGYLKELKENEAVHSYAVRHGPEILEQFDPVLNTASMEETVEQTEREESPIGAASAAQAQPSRDDADAMSNPSMEGQIGRLAWLEQRFRNHRPNNCSQSVNMWSHIEELSPRNATDPRPTRF